MQLFWLNLLGWLASPLTWICAVFGAIFGSFLNVCIFRIPEGTFWRHQRSVCIRSVCMNSLLRAYQ